jgi:hypothetical protein
MVNVCPKVGMEFEQKYKQITKGLIPNLMIPKDVEWITD